MHLMWRTIGRPLAFLTGILAPVVACAQDVAPNWLVDTLYGSGKINTVVAVVAVILIGLGAWLFFLDRRITKLERIASENRK